MPNNTRIPSQIIPLVDKTTGLMTREWYRFFANSIESSWTPEFTGSVSNPTVTYTVQNGGYVRINGSVQCNVILTWTSFSGGSGDIRISLPLPVKDGITGIPSGSISLMNGVNLPASIITVGVSGVVGQSFLKMTGLKDNSDTVVLAVSDINNAGSIGLSLSYVTV